MEQPYVIDRGANPNLPEARPTMGEALLHKPLGVLPDDPGSGAEGFH
jgi:hypothetical protein